MKVYLVCPVTNCSLDVKTQMDAYVADLESRGYDVHYPPRDVCQDADRSVEYICETHVEAMLDCDEVHVWWDPNSKGSHFDLGMAYMLNQYGPLKFVLANEYAETPHRSYGNLLRNLARK